MSAHRWQPSTRNGQPILTCANEGCRIIWWSDRKEPKSGCAGTPEAELVQRMNIVARAIWEGL